MRPGLPEMRSAQSLRRRLHSPHRGPSGPARRSIPPGRAERGHRWEASRSPANLPRQNQARTIACRAARSEPTTRRVSSRAPERNSRVLRSSRIRAMGAGRDARRPQPPPSVNRARRRPIPPSPARWPHLTRMPVPAASIRRDRRRPARTAASVRYAECGCSAGDRW